MSDTDIDSVQNNDAEESANVFAEALATDIDLHSYTEQQMELLNRFNSPTEVMDHLLKLEEDYEKTKKSYDHLKQLTSRKVQDFSKESWEEYAKIQQEFADIPAEASGYDSPTWTFANEDVKTKFQEFCKELNVDKATANRMYEISRAEEEKQSQKVVTQLVEYENQNYEKLKNKWGKAYDSKLDLARHAIINVLPKITGSSTEELISMINQSGLNSSAEFLQVMAALGELSGGSASNGYGSNPSIGPYDAKVRIEQMMSDGEISQALGNKFHPKHRQYRAEWDTLHRIQSNEH